MLSFIFLLYAVYVFVAVFISFLYSDYYIGFYDGVNRLLPHMYMQQGLVPYKDFDHGYAPGNLVLIGRIIPFVSLFQRNAILAVGSLLIIVLTVSALQSFTDSIRKKMVTVSGYLLLVSFVLKMIPWGDPFSLFLYGYLFILLVQAEKAVCTRKMWLIIGCITAILVWFRWDWILATGVILLLQSLLFHVSDAFKQSVRMVMFGIVAGTGSLLLYVYTIGAFVDFFQSVIVRQVLLNYLYRRIPISIMVQFPIDLFIGVYVVCVNIALLCSIWMKRRRIRRVSYLFTAFSLLVLVYGVSRVDIFHLLPLIYVSGICCLVLYLTGNNRRYLALFAILMLPFLNHLVPGALKKPDHTSLEKQISSQIADCKDAIPTSEQFSSLFVGRLSYDRITSSIGSLYFIQPRIPPASKFLFDVPGIQTDCITGQSIVSQLLVAKRPMLTLLDLTEFDPENQVIASLKSCGKIESFLRTQPYTTIGTCRSFDHQFVIRSYK